MDYCTFWFEDYTKIRELNQVPRGVENSVDSSFPNLELFVKWTDWSCCSACCCPKSVCKQFETSGDKCKTLKSYQNRRGELMFRQTGEIGNDELEKLFQENSEVKFSKARNISALSSILDKSRVSLNQKLKVPSDTLAVFQLKDCKDHIQKMDCWELAKCLYGNSSMLPEKEVAKIEERDVCENSSIFVIRDAYNILSLMPDKLYRIQVDSKIGSGSLLKVNYTIHGKRVKKLGHLRDCEHQTMRIFQHPNGVDLIIRLNEKQLARNPKITAVISYQSLARLEIIVDLVSKTKTKRQ
uniref:YkgJ family cysteine cluster protein n=1 Tax=Caenorhabditis tropicalis TaxID=1561998 RepID=A0A1I7T2B6_9PELO